MAVAMTGNGQKTVSRHFVAGYVSPVASQPQRKRRPSEHQKQIRFLTMLALLLVIGLVAGLLWLVNLNTLRVH